MKNEHEVLIDIEGIKNFMKDSVDRFFHGQEIKKKNYQKVEVKTCDDSPAFSEIYIGGQKIEGVRSYSITHKAGDLPRITLDINALNLSIDGHFVCTAEGWGDFAMKMINPCSDKMEEEK